MTEATALKSGGGVGWFFFFYSLGKFCWGQQPPVGIVLLDSNVQGATGRSPTSPPCWPVCLTCRAGTVGHHG